ncbi:MAG: cell division protein ZapA [Candidatus Marinimicrobia bacterium]|nr:cell division protein ZapA [Candidatus Neomarinimicrobiota bacterium]|tara:strand:+ start:3117 stop:3437 length:321 start_codon:yes stop_codon:yes gene_type:complete
MSNESKNLTVNIYGQDYVLRSTGNQDYINKIADYVNSKMKEIESTGLDASSQQLKIAVLSAMNIADELFQSMDKNSEIITTIEAKGNSFIEYIDDRIKEIESQDKG